MSNFFNEHVMAWYRKRLFSGKPDAYRKLVSENFRSSLRTPGEYRGLILTDEKQTCDHDVTEPLPPHGERIFNKCFEVFK